MNSVADVWENVLQQLREELSETTISIWFSDLEAVEIHGTTFYLHSKNDFKKSNVEKLFKKNILAVLKNIFSIDFDVVILSDEEYKAFMSEKEPESVEDFSSDRFTFDTFVVGPSNKLAYAASRAVAEKPAQNYNPLFIYGDSGLGKTHLIYAIANAIRAHDKDARIAYVRGDTLTNELVTAIQAGPQKTAEMREKYRQASLLMVDDVQFIAGRKQTQEEFFHTFNELYESGRQIILTSDRPPSEMTLLDDRLKSRFEWGLKVDVGKPDYETRLAIVKNKAAHLGLNLSDAVCACIAQNITANVRQLEGAINQLQARKELMDDVIDEETAKTIIQTIIAEDEAAPSPETILSAVAEYYGLDVEALVGKQRMRQTANARQVAIYLIRSLCTSLSFEEIGKYIGNRDHTTILYSVQQVEKKMKTDSHYAETVKALKTNISSRE